MAFRTWGRLLLTALGVSVLAGAGQLGVAYGFGIVRLTGAFTGTTVNQWPAQLVWVGWFAANAAVAGAVLTGRLARRDAVPASTGRQLAIGAAAALGATVVAPLCMQPARAAELISVDPVWAVGICAVLGAVIGAGAATAVLLRPELGWNMAAVAGAIWVLALISVLPSLGTVGPLPTVRLGVLEPSWLDDGAAQRLALVLLPLTALLAGAATAGLARWRGQVPLVSGATGVAGPVLVAFAYLTAGPGDAVDRYQTTPYYGALIAILAGALGAAAAALLRWPVRARTAGPRAIEPSDILRPLPTGPALPGADPANSADDRDAAEPTGADLAGTSAKPTGSDLAGTSAGHDPRAADSIGAGHDLRTADGTGAVRTVPAHWDWPAASGIGQHGPVPAHPTGTPVPRPAGRSRHHTDDPGDPATTAATGGPSTSGPAQDGPVGVDHRETGPADAARPVRGTRRSAADVAGPAEPTRAATTDGTGPSDSLRTGVDPAVPTGGPGDEGSTSTAATATTGTAQPTGGDAASIGPTNDGTATATSASTATGSAGTASKSAATTSAETTSAETTSAETTSESAGAAGNGPADAPAPKPRRTRKPKSAPAVTTTDLVDGATPSGPEAAADPARSKTAGRARRTTRPAKVTDGTGSGTATDGSRQGKDAPGAGPGRGPSTPAATPAATTEPAAAEPAADSATAVAPGTDRTTDTERPATAGGPAGPLFGVAAAAAPEADRWTPAAPAWPVTPAWTAPAQAGDPEPTASDAPTGPEEPTERTPRPRHRAPLPDLSRASTWDAFTTARREGAAEPQRSSTGAARPASTDSPTADDPASSTGSSSPTGPATPTGPRSASARAATRWRRAAGTPDPAAEAGPAAPPGPAGPTAPLVPEQTPVGTEAGTDTGGPASAEAVPAAPAAGNDAEQPSRRGRLGGLFRRNRSRAEEESQTASDATEPLPAQDEEFVDWVSGLSKPVADNEPEQENGRRSLRSTGRHHRD
ncbi:hypothetical protein [Micromonospora sp. U21]|uniref:hypothetical protein n=1 Tax=Micromonospora sp. U21 TaxID=2824899 RepID=UPI001B396F2E|nr:hypothetical protein [Micromonospora sp. U21]MBQ0904878.1 hypothetical protein [Micromonospora sp. U21]